MLGGGFGLVQTRQPAIVAFIEVPVLIFGNPHLARRFQRQMQCGSRGSEPGESHGRQDALFLEQGAGRAGFAFTLFGKIHVPPSGEAVFKVPLALTT
jgi:hypothetical protein